METASSSDDRLSLGLFDAAREGAEPPGGDRTRAAVAALLAELPTFEPRQSSVGESKSGGREGRGRGRGLGGGRGGGWSGGGRNHHHNHHQQPTERNRPPTRAPGRPQSLRRVMACLNRVSRLNFERMSREIVLAFHGIPPEEARTATAMVVDKARRDGSDACDTYVRLLLGAAVALYPSPEATAIIEGAKEEAQAVFEPSKAIREVSMTVRDASPENDYDAFCSAQLSKTKLMGGCRAAVALARLAPKDLWPDELSPESLMRVFTETLVTISSELPDPSIEAALEMTADCMCAVAEAARDPDLRRTASVTMRRCLIESGLVHGLGSRARHKVLVVAAL